MIYIFLECRDHEQFSMTSEETFMTFLWKNHTVEFIPCEGNLNLINKLKTFTFALGDSVYIHYDTVNAVLAAKQALFQQVVEIYKNLAERNVNCYLFKFLSFEHCILCSSILEQMVPSDDEALLNAVRFFKSYDNIKGLPELSTEEVKQKYPTVCYASSTTIEQCISNICRLACAFGGKSFVCTKSKLGGCWTIPCSVRKISYCCIKAKNKIFSTDLCEHEDKQAALLNSLSADKVEELYITLALNTMVNTSEQPTHLFN